MPRWPFVVVLAACDQGPDAPFPVSDVYVLSPSDAKVSLPEARYTAPAQFQTFTIENTGAVPIFVTPALNLATATGDADALDLDVAARLVVTDMTPLTEISPGQTKALQVTLDDRTWRWATGAFEATIPLGLDYLWNGQAVGEPDPGDEAVPQKVSGRVDLHVAFSMDCDLDDDGVDAVACGGQDCDDQDEAVLPGATETCDGVDEDCDGAVDEEAVDRTPWYLDHDLDNFGDPESEVIACGRPSASYRDVAGDCDDDDDDVNPNALEVCSNHIDDDCDGQVDGDDPDC
jgi:hypothetical protein